jgi:hypothetical protein
MANPFLTILKARYAKSPLPAVNPPINLKREAEPYSADWKREAEPYSADWKREAEPYSADWKA